MNVIHIAPDLHAACPEMALGCILCDVLVRDSPAALLAAIDTRCNDMAATMDLEAIHRNRAISDTREAYRRLGKEPSRYRPSAEALMRRVLQGKGLYQVNNVVDLLNLVSIRHGFSIGGWDADLIDGEMTLGVGRDNEPYETIGRGEMNIACFPTFRDGKGAFGTPTSDSARTMVRPETRRFLMVIYAFGGRHGLQPAMDEAQQLLRDYGGSTSIEVDIIS